MLPIATSDLWIPMVVIMVTVMELREQAVNLDNPIEELRTEMVGFLKAYTHQRWINVMLWYDGQLKIMAKQPIEDEILQLFIKSFGLKEKGHFMKNETKYHSIYMFKHWDFE